LNFVVVKLIMKSTKEIFKILFCKPNKTLGISWPESYRIKRNLIIADFMTDLMYTSFIVTATYIK